MKKKATNVHWHEGIISREDRAAFLGHGAAALWFTGLSGSGKSTIAVRLEDELYKRKRLSYRLDGDNIRMGINKNLGFSPEDRRENIRRIGEISKLFVDSGIIVINCFISPYREDRRLCRLLHEQAGMPFIEIYVRCPLEVAEQRDPKGLYKKAKAGEIPDFTGISAPYEEPECPELLLDSSMMSLDEEVALIVDELSRRGIC